MKPISPTVRPFGRACCGRRWRGAIALVLAGCLLLPSALSASGVSAAGTASKEQGAERLALWVWDARVVTEPRAQHRLLNFCRRGGVGILYLSAYDLRAPMDKAYRSFNRRAHEAGLEVHALAGDPRWAKSRYHHIPLRWADSVRALNQKARPEERFDGLHTDIEAYLLSKSWRERPEVLLGSYLELTRKLAGKAWEAPHPIAYGVDIPFWFDDDISYRILWNGSIKPPSHHVMDFSDFVTVMAYRNFAEGPDGTIHLVRLEMDYGDKIGKKVFVGQETQEDLFPTYITFGGTSCRVLKREMGKVRSAYRDRTSFGGFAIHHYDSYRKLCSQ